MRRFKERGRAWAFMGHEGKRAAGSMGITSGDLEGVMGALAEEIELMGYSPRTKRLYTSVIKNYLEAGCTARVFLMGWPERVYQP